MTSTMGTSTIAAATSWFSGLSLITIMLAVGGLALAFMVGTWAVSKIRARGGAKKRRKK